MSPHPASAAAIPPVAPSLAASARAPGRPLAFINFRFVSDGAFDVLYVYELQLEPCAQRRGLGRFLMSAAELAARQAGMQAVMLTVFKANAGALDFYTQRMKYCVDPDSPSSCGDAGKPYEILSKVVDRRAYEERERLLEDGLIVLEE
jgi:ribosomal protein S18 acetylase RimI-like enzyme